MTERRPAWIYLLLGMAPFSVYGFRAEFFQTDPWRTAGIVLGTVPGLLIAAGVISGIRENFVYRRLSPFALTVGLWMTVPAFTIFYCWAALGVGLPCVYTHFAGDPRSAIFEARLQEVGPGRSCRYRIFGEPFEKGGLENYYCASKPEFARLPAAQGPALVLWRESWFGRHIDSVSPRPPQK